jgi:predicted O-methyltransferase YrrM
MSITRALGRLTKAWASADDSAVARVTRAYSRLPYMQEPQCQLMRRIITENDSADILELGFFHGKSSAYIAAILEDRGKGHLTTMDKANARERSPSIHDVLQTVGLAHRVTPIFAERSFTWELGELLKENPEPRFDLCYLDGGHTWDTTGFAFFLVDMLLRPGGVIVFDDMDWTAAASPRGGKGVPESQKTVKQVRKVFDLLVKPRGYVDLEEFQEAGWGLARKPR